MTGSRVGPVGHDGGGTFNKEAGTVVALGKMWVGLMRRTKEIQIWPGRVIEQGLKPVSLREWVGIMELVSAASWGLGIADGLFSTQGLEH